MLVESLDHLLVGQLPQLSSGLHVANESRTSPHKWVIALVPVDTTEISWSNLIRETDSQGLASSNSRVGCPGPAKHNVVFLIEEIGFNGQSVKQLTPSKFLYR